MSEHKKPRFLVRGQTVGRTTTYWIYDRVTGSWPSMRPAPVGAILQNVTVMSEAEAEARRLEELYARELKKEKQ